MLKLKQCKYLLWRQKLWFMSDLVKPTLVSQQPLHRRRFSFLFLWEVTNTRANHMWGVHPTTVVYIRKCSQQSKTMSEFWWSKVSCSQLCKPDIKHVFKGFFKACHHEVKRALRSDADVNGAGGDGTFHNDNHSWGCAGHWNLGCSLIGPKATLQTGSDTGEGAQEVRGRAVMFSCVPIPSLAVARCQLKGGWREERGQQSQPMNLTKPSTTLTHDLCLWSWSWDCCRTLESDFSAIVGKKHFVCLINWTFFMRSQETCVQTDNVPADLDV